MRSGVALAAAALLLAPASAQATTRHVSPAGVASGGCERAAPCSAAWALGGGSAPGDEIVVAPGTYVDQPLVLDHRLTVTAAPDGPRPLFRTAVPGAVALRVGEDGGDSVVEHLDLRSTGAGGAGVEVGAAATLDDLVVQTTDGPCLHSAATGVRLGDDAFARSAAGAGPCLETTGDDTFWDDVRVSAGQTDTAAAFTGNGRITDIVATARLTGLQVGGSARVHRVTASGDEHGIVLAAGHVLLTDSVAVARGGGAAIFTANGRHDLIYVTAWGDGPGSFGVRAGPGGQLTVRNSIVRGREVDLLADPAPQSASSDCAEPAGCPGGRIVVDHSNFRTGFGVESDVANQSADPRFVDPAAGNFRVRAGSPVIDVGTFDLNSTSTDRAGRFRWLGLQPDMGAYEFPSARPPVLSPDRRAPTLGAVRLTRPVFRAGRRGAAFSAARRPPVGSRLDYVVSEAADLVVLVARRGERPAIGALVQPSRRGANRLAIGGAVEGRLLRPGRYVLTIFARDDAQNLSAPRTLPFTVVA